MNDPKLVRSVAARTAAFCTVFALSLLAGAAHAQKAEKAEKAAAKASDPPKPTIIAGGKMHEKCMTLSSAQKLEYQFTTSKPVDFNIHYHRGETVYYPVKRNKTTAEADRFTPGTGRSDYCLMWENKSSADIELNYAYKVVNN